MTGAIYSHASISSLNIQIARRSLIMPSSRGCRLASLRRACTARLEVIVIRSSAIALHTLLWAKTDAPCGLMACRRPSHRRTPCECCCVGEHYKYGWNDQIHFACFHFGSSKPLLSSVHFILHNQSISSRPIALFRKDEWFLCRVSMSGPHLPSCRLRAQARAWRSRSFLVYELESYSETHEGYWKSVWLPARKIPLRWNSVQRCVPRVLRLRHL